MIKSIDINNFGSFKNFIWRNCVRDSGGNVEELKRLNIFYGRNYSGKTTLSRVLRSFQMHMLPVNYASPKFAITTDARAFNQTEVAAHSLDIRVYNTDFVTDNLSFLTNHEDGEIKTFAIIGGENKETERQIAEKEALLGHTDSENGLIPNHTKKSDEYFIKLREANTAKSALEERLRRHANDVIKKNRVYGDSGYILTSIQNDIKTISKISTAILDEVQISEQHALIKEEELPDIQERLSFLPQIKVLYEQACKILIKQLTPTKPIQDLLNNALLQSWVLSGMPLHRNKRETCGFCRQPLPDNIWSELDAHFSKESLELENVLKILIEELEAEIESAKLVIKVHSDNFYTSKLSIFNKSKKTLEQELKKYEKELNSYIKLLRTRQADIFKSVTCPELTDNSDVIACLVSEINTLINENNAKTKSLAIDKQKARLALRLNDVARFIKNINLIPEEEKNKKLAADAENIKKEVNHLKNQIDVLNAEINSLNIKLKDEKKGAEKINEYLSHYFGLSGLKLVAIEDVSTAKFKFQIMRGTEPAYNLSEGECSLVSFCYFMAKLEDSDTKGKELLIYIDDPISSLDSNHIFFIYSLIESVIAKPVKKLDGSNEYRYRQMFISTHNLDFLKYLKRLSIPNSKHGDTAYFMVEQVNDSSQLSLMPAYLKNYVTEFNYLFHQIYKCRNPEYAKEDYVCFYSFGNNLRKFLEAYLFYKYPYHDDKNDALEKLTKFFGEDSTSTALINRISNELSHLQEIFDRSMYPIEIPEIPKLANFVLDKIFEKDKEQYNSLLKSIGEPVRE